MAFDSIATTWTNVTNAVIAHGNKPDIGGLSDGSTFDITRPDRLAYLLQKIVDTIDHINEN